jgi:16S rRNA (cytidine1402-2'-O)-methyltransferase
MAKFYVVGPLGDGGRDVPLRALHVLHQVSLIMAQDVESAREWLRQAGISTPVHDIRGSEAISLLLETLHNKDVAWLVQALAELSGSARGILLRLIEHGIEPLSVPGSSRELASLAVSGLSTDSLTLLGVLPEYSGERRALLEAVASEPRTVICDAAAEHLADLRRDLLACLGDRRVTLHGMRDTWRGRAAQMQGWPESKERLMLVIEGADRDQAWPTARVDAELRKLLAAGGSPRDVARDVSRRSGWPSRQVYQLIVSAREEG